MSPWHPFQVRRASRVSKTRASGAVVLALAVALLLVGGGSAAHAASGVGASATGAQRATPDIFKCAASDAARTPGHAYWAQFGYGPADNRCQPFERLLSPATVPGLTLGWHVTSATFGSAVPAVVDGIVYAPSEYPDNKLYAFNAATGATLWAAPIPTQIQTNPSAPAVARGVVYISVNDTLYTFSAATGTPGWSFTTGNFLQTPPAISGQTVFVASQDGHLYALRATTGKLLWSAVIGSNPVFVPGPVAIANGAVYVAAGHALQAFAAANGRLLWSVPFSVSGAAPVYTNGLVYIGSLDFNLYAFNAKTGAQVWASATGNIINPSVAVDRTTAYVGSANGKVYAFNAKTGALDWASVTNPSDQVFAAAALANGVVYVASACDCSFDSENHLFAFQATTGALLWSYAPGYPVYTAPVVANGQLYWGTYTGFDTFHR